MITDELLKTIKEYVDFKFKDYNHRLKHIYNVKKVAITLGKIYKVDLPSIIAASYLHDITKKETIEENIKIAGKQIDNFVPKGCIHAYAAYNIAKNQFKITDLDLLNAIKYHCSGRKNMSLIEKIIFVSDYIEEDREFATEELRNISKTNLDKAVYLIMTKTRKYLLDNSQEVSPKTEEAIVYYKKKVEELNG